MRRHIALLTAAALLVAADTKDDPAKKARGQLQGYWNVIQIERDGTKISGRKFGDKDFRQVVFTDKKITLTRGTKEGGQTATYKLDPNQKPKTIDITFVTGPDEGKTFRGVYALEKDRLKICWSSSGQKRPTGFSTKPKSSHTLLILKRGKP
jgi:uncharacterized protein (TIGR03067 family)